MDDPRATAIVALAASVARLLRMAEDGLLVDDEVAVAIVEDAYSVAQRSALLFRGTPTDEVVADLLRRTILEADDPRHLAMLLHPWTTAGADRDQAFTRLCDAILEDALDNAAGGAQVDAGVAALAHTISQHRNLSAAVAAAVRTVTADHALARVALEVALRDRDLERAAVLVDPHAATGDVWWPCHAIAYLIRTEDSKRAPWSRRLVRHLEPDAVAAVGGADSITALAASLSGAGLDNEAHTWSGLVGDPSCSDAEPRDHLAWLRAVLSAVDLLAGDTDRARRRAALSTDRDAGWEYAAHRALALWVAARTSDDEAESERLLASAGYRHTWLGAIQQQIDLDRAALAEERGERRQAAALREQARKASESRAVALHLGHFPYQDLLARLPVESHVR